MPSLFLLLSIIMLFLLAGHSTSHRSLLLSNLFLFRTCILNSMFQPGIANVDAVCVLVSFPGQTGGVHTQVSMSHLSV